MIFTKHFIRFVCVIIACTAMAGQAQAKTIYVSQSASDKGDGSAHTPFNTITKAVNSKLKPGDEIVVRDGIYNESVFIPAYKSGLPGRPITLRSDTPRGAKIRAVKAHSIMTFASYIRIQGFDAVGGISGHGVHHVEVLNNVVHDSKAGGIYFARSEFLLVAGNVTHSNSSDAVNSGISIHIPQNVSGDTTTKGFRIIVRNNWSYNNVMKMKTGMHTDGDGIIFDDWMLRFLADNPEKYEPGTKPYRYPGLIENNLVYGNGGPGIIVFVTDNITVRNNTSFNNSTDPLNKTLKRFEMVNVSGSHNTWVNNIAVAVPPKPEKHIYAFGNISRAGSPKNVNVVGVNNLSFNGTPGDRSVYVNGGNSEPPAALNFLGVDPRFVTPMKNARLRPGSPAIDAGTLKYGSHTTSLSGPRKIGKGIDLGAYER